MSQILDVNFCAFVNFNLVKFALSIYFNLAVLKYIVVIVVLGAVNLC